MSRDPVRRLAWQRANQRRKMIKFFYGLSLEQYDEQLRRQDGVCALCKQPPRGNQKSLSVDHDHNQHEHAGTKRGCPECVRGLLCFNCNRSVLPVLEKNEELQSETVKRYLSGRPFGV